MTCVEIEQRIINYWDIALSTHGSVLSRFFQMPIFLIWPSINWQYYRETDLPSFTSNGESQIVRDNCSETHGHCSHTEHIHDPYHYFEWPKNIKMIYNAFFEHLQWFFRRTYWNMLIVIWKFTRESYFNDFPRRTWKTSDPFFRVATNVLFLTWPTCRGKTQPIVFKCVYCNQISAVKSYVFSYVKSQVHRD